MSASSSQDEIAAIHRSVGEAIDAWSVVEQALESLFAILTTADPVEAHIVMASVISFPSRIKMCSALMRRHRKLEGAGNWPPLSKQLKQLYAKRHELAHFSVVQLNDEFKLLPFYSMGRSMTEFLGTDTLEFRLPHNLSASDIDGRVREFRTLAASLSEFSVALRREREELIQSRASEQPNMR